ncbi:MAG: type IV pili methyl-accepting chemotaxis transducer N-terminal domain-containing protein [Candidatus Thiodiazotropha sp. (ex Lucinoma annulata)]|nr:type IV pili methyl-accepting chemotaxis transducer N-terminal domain-containing protein [Candidatus Thiodiazotropha sp. (ex Lucinoma borealis)]MCU7838138.1 type IV pili methyl-accepting chemotaxis transducer N-terminal domain-containing protein [Candidatus Thiodiazotropha sp. (ex Troendleina suluensis)]MCU7866263.1 type IV pili methyl-accepting chemotaxis transducer N-terminal domain-containing protein [Candidatus Thiodiazotropha sp. (ex Lucinoma borealis)]MCU7869069.1 type IV pili methyl-ac
MKNSLLLRFGTVITILFILAVSGMVSSMIITETAEGYAAAINQAGTLRMQSYRIASSLVHRTKFHHQLATTRTSQLVTEYSQRLFSPRIHDVLTKGPNKQVTETYHEVESQWRETMLPNLNDYLKLSATNSLSSQERRQLDTSLRNYLALVDSFVDDIHRFVEALEIDAEEKNQQLRVIQIVLLSLTFLVTLVSLYLTKSYVLNPLRNLLACANAARHGDFSIRSRYLGEDELGQLGQAFNVMAEDLSVTYADLESRVREKTHDLERSNHTLELLYSATKRLSDSSLSEDVLVAVIHDIESLIGVNNGTICLGQPGDDQAYRYASTRKTDILLQDKLDNQCSICLGEGKSHTFKITAFDTQNSVNIFSTPVRDKTQQYGVLLVEFSEAMQLEEWQERLLETVASNIALAINVAQQVTQNRKVSLMEERSVIARELHDSIAQSLSYLKIQVSRLEKAINEDSEKKEILSVTAALRLALNGAYRQLRELLTTFRLRVTDANLGKVVGQTVEEFANRSGIPIEYTNHIGNCQFTPNAEIHIIQIIREALSNVIRHANATQARVSLECNQQGLVKVSIEDDGIGINDEGDMMQHYGLPIMKERAEWLGGSLSINESPTGGTQINLNFNITDTSNSESKKLLVEQLKNA